ncbi:3122_t:CDS:1, partial [Racocetra fulgida]
IYYNPWTDLDFDQIDQKPIPDVLPIEENLPTEQEALQSIFIPSDNTEDIDDNQDPWEIDKESVIASGQAPRYNLDDELSDKWNLDSSDEESLYSIPRRNKEPPTYYIKDLIDIRLNQIQYLLKLRINHSRLKKVLFILGDMQHFLYPNLPHPLQNLNRDFYKLYEAKTKKAQDRLLKQVQRKVKLCQNIKIKGFVLTE